jgi:hypothetical protein
MTAIESEPEITISSVICIHGWGHNWVPDEDVDHEDIHPDSRLYPNEQGIRERCVYCGYLRWSSPILPITEAVHLEPITDRRG